MCIRDSKTTDWGHLTNLGFSALTVVALVGLISALGGSPLAAGLAGPVSYTHLRAHETVLDLVCRLLLEKKTKTQKKKEHSCQL